MPAAAAADNSPEHVVAGAGAVSVAAVPVDIDAGQIPAKQTLEAGLARSAELASSSSFLCSLLASAAGGEVIPAYIVSSGLSIET